VLQVSKRLSAALHCELDRWQFYINFVGRDFNMIKNKFSGRLPVRLYTFFTAIILFCNYSLPADEIEPYKYKPADLHQVKNSDRSEIMIMPQSFLREYDPLTIMYPDEMHSEGAGPLDKPQEFLTMKPVHPGEYRWLDSRTIEFRPSVPWQPMQTYNIKVKGMSKALTALLMPPRSIFPSSGSTGLDPVSRIMLEFEEQIDHEVLAKLLTFEACELPGIERNNCRTYTASDFTIKKSEKSVKNSYQYWIVFKKPFANGLRVRTIIRLASDPMLSDAKRVYFFDTRKEFTIEQAGTYEYQFTLNPSGSAYGKEQALKLSNEAVLYFDFSVPPVSLSLSQVKSLVNFSPSPRKMDWSVSGNRLIIKIIPEQEKLYKVVISPVNIEDRDGRKLGLHNRCSFYCYQPLDRQYARWGLGFCMVERYGPQHFPFLVSGVKSIDLRVYKIDPQHKAFWPFPYSPVSVSETDRPPGPGEEPVSEDKISSPLNAWEIGAHIRMLGSPHYSAVVDLDKEGVTRFQSIDLRPVFEKISGMDRPGTYLAGFRTLDGVETRSYIRVQVTDLCLSTVEAKSHVNFLVTSFSTGKPVSDAEILIEGVNSGSFVELSKGKTDNNGMFIMEHSDELQKSFKNSSVKRIIVKRAEDLLVLDSRGSECPQSFANNHWYSNNYSWLEWLSNDRYDFRTERVQKAFIFSERPIYRPDETVYFKGYVRSLFQGKIEKFDTSLSHTVNITSPSGARYSHPVKLTEYYSFSDSLVEKDLPTGEYQVELTCAVKDRGEMSLAQTSFAIEAYRIPKFEVRLSGPEKTPNDRSVNVDLVASYYAGGKVAGQNVSWRVVSYPYAYTPESASGYLLSTDNRYGGVDGESSEGVIEQTDVTGDDGQASLVVNVQSATKGNPRKYVCEATVTDVDEQTVSDRHSFIALPPFALGMKIERHITGTRSIKAQVIALGIKGKFEAKHKVNVQLKKVSWTSFLQETDFSRGKPKYLTQESIDVSGEKSVVTDVSPVTVEFADNDPGVYILEISSRDRLGRIQLVKADLFLAGNRSVTWKKGEQLVFETVPDKERYEPGQQAKILLKSPYQRGNALAVVEKPDGIPEYRWIEISDGQGTFNLSITPDMAPRIPVSFLLMRPRISNEKKLPDGSTVDAGKPQTVANTTWLNVTQIDNVLKVTLDHPSSVRPGSRIDMTLSLKDGRGEPRDGEVALWLVDEAVLALATEKQLDPLPVFTADVNSHIALRDSRNMVYGDLRIPQNPGGDGEEGDGDMFGKVTVRKNFKTVPYWKPDIIVDKSGQAVVSFTMSDDLTNFAVRAVAVSGPDRFGVGKSQVKVRLPLIVQPSLPRFVRPGDKIIAGGVVRVIEGGGGDAKFTTELQGLKFTGNGLSGECKLDKTKPSLLKAEMTADDIRYDSLGNQLNDSVRFKMSVVRLSDKISDAFSISLPIITDRYPVEYDTFAEITQSKGVKIPAIKEKVREGTLKRQILISNQMAILKVVSGMRNLVNYQYGCTEQRVSRAYPGVVYRDIWANYGLETPEKNIKKNIAETNEYLSRIQNPDGFFGYWPGSRGYVYLTAYVTDFLTEVKSANKSSNTGYKFDDEMYRKAIDALKRSIRNDYGSYVDGYKYFERSAALLALANASELDIGYARELAAQTNETDVQSQAKVLAALYKNESALGSDIKELNKNLWNQTVFKLDNGKEVFGGLQERSFRIGARVHTNEISSLASMIAAFSLAPKRSPKLPSLVNELVDLGGNGDWGSTQANSLALLAMRNYLEKPDGKSKATLRLSSESLQTDLQYESKQGAKTWSFCANTKKIDLNLVSSSDNSPYFIRYSHRYMSSEPGYKAPAIQKGFVVRRELVLVKGDGKSSRMWLDSANTVVKVQSGDIIEEHIVVQNPRSCNFVAVCAPFAAGLEYMNPRLETSGDDATPDGTTTNAGDYQECLDDRIVYYFENMNSGTFDFYFRLKATVTGEYTHPSARAEMMYDMATYGCSPGAKIVVGE